MPVSTSADDPGHPRTSSGAWPQVAIAVTAVALLAPEAVAFAQIAGVPAADGLAAAPPCALAYALVGRSRRLVVGATAATAVISASAVAGLPVAPADRAAAASVVALTAGVVLVVTGLLRCGSPVHFLSPQALLGLLFGLAAFIVVRQAEAVRSAEPNRCHCPEPGAAGRGDHRRIELFGPTNTALPRGE